MTKANMSLAELAEKGPDTARCGVTPRVEGAAVRQHR